MEAPLQQRIKPSLVVRGIAECVHFKRSPHFFLSRPFCALCSCRKGIVLFLPPSDFLHHLATSLASLISCHASTPDNFSRLLSGRCHPSTRCGRAVGPLGKADLLQAIIQQRRRRLGVPVYRQVNSLKYGIYELQFKNIFALSVTSTF